MDDPVVELQSKDRYRASAIERRRWGGDTVTEFWVIYRGRNTGKVALGHGKTPSERKARAREVAAMIMADTALQEMVQAGRPFSDREEAIAVLQGKKKRRAQKKKAGPRAPAAKKKTGRRGSSVAAPAGAVNLRSSSGVYGNFWEVDFTGGPGPYRIEEFEAHWFVHGDELPAAPRLQFVNETPHRLCAALLPCSDAAPVGRTRYMLYVRNPAWAPSPVAGEPPWATVLPPKA